jgi:hypothetical protein
MSRYFLLLFFGLLLTSCSNEPQSPVAPGDPAELQKVICEAFTGTEEPIEVLYYGREKEVNGKLIVQQMELRERLETTNPMLTGEMLTKVSINLDLTTGEAHFSGGGTVTPDDPAAGGVWHFSMQGNREKTGESEWTAIFQLNAHGKGGLIQGRQLFATATQTSWDARDTYYVTTVEGFIKYNAK